MTTSKKLNGNTWELLFNTPISIEQSKLSGYVYSNIEGRPRVNLNNINKDEKILIINVDSKYPLIEFLP